MLSWERSSPASLRMVSPIVRASQVALVVKNLPVKCRRRKKIRFYPWVGKIPCRRKWQPTPVFLPGESHGQRSLVGYSAWSHKKLDMIEATYYTRHTSLS